MKKNGIAPNSATYNAILKKYGMSLDNAIELMKIMESEKISPNEITYTTIIKKPFLINKPSTSLLEYHEIKRYCAQFNHI